MIATLLHVCAVFGRVVPVTRNEEYLLTPNRNSFQFHHHRFGVAGQVQQRAATPSSANCTWLWFEQPLDHFANGIATTPSTFSQRVCINTDHLQANGAILFYTGNESPVEVYVNNTGLMWNLAQSLGAAVVFAEHRYFGQSIPSLRHIENCFGYLTSSQALADYIHLIDYLRTKTFSNPSMRVIAFGGSYGGMLSAWIRMKYPTVISGAIASSAPIWGFPLLEPQLDGAYRAVTEAASDATVENCANNIRAVWPLLSAVGEYEFGREAITSSLNLCETPNNASDVVQMIRSLQDTFFILSEGDYPFETNYISFAVEGTIIPLPAWPMRAACSHITNFNVNVTGNVSDVRFTVRKGQIEVQVDWDTFTANQITPQLLQSSGVLDLFSAMKDVVGTLLNLTGDTRCLNWRQSETRSVPSAAHSTSACLSQSVDPGTAWNVLVCNEGLNLVQYIVKGVGNDMFWPPSAPRNFTIQDVGIDHSLDFCNSLRQNIPGIPDADSLDPWARWEVLQYGNKDLSSFSNMFFANGQFDPWTAAGVSGKQKSDSIFVEVIAKGAHHLDLFFPTDSDPDEVKDVRKKQELAIRQWLEL